MKPAILRAAGRAARGADHVDHPAQGLRRAGAAYAAARLAARTVGLVAEHGFREYFDPRTGEGMGARDFARSAAPVIDLMAEM